MNKDAQRFLQEAERQGFVSKPVKKGTTTSVERIARDEHRDMVCSYRLGRRMHR